MKKLLLVLSVSLFLFSCNDQGDVSTESQGNSDSVGKSGSTSKFAIIGGYLYIVEGSYLKTIDITDPAKPEQIDEILVRDDLETIFPYKHISDGKEEDVLLLGALSGMHIYKINLDGTPNNGENIVLQHQRSCDPVVAYDGYAYFTLREGAGCREGQSELHTIDFDSKHIEKKLIDLNDLDNPKDETPIAMDGPKGLSFSNDKRALLVCDKNSLKVFSLEIPEEPEEIESAEKTNIQCNDIVEYKELYIVTGDNLLKLYTFDPITYELNWEFDFLDVRY